MSEVAANQDQAFRIEELDTNDGIVIVVIKKGILGATAKQLKATSSKRKGATIIRKLGYELAKAGDILYATDPVAAAKGSGLEDVVDPY